MNGSLAMRSTRLRTLLLCLVGGGMLLSFYLLTSSQYHLNDAKHALETCQQQKDSLLAQLQVVYEQKNRVEKTLQQERLDHRKTQEDNQKNNFIRLQVQKAKVQVDTKLSALQQDQQTLQERYHELESQTAELREQQTKNEEKRIKQQTDYEQNIKSKDTDILLLQGNLTMILQERDRLESQNVKYSRDSQNMRGDMQHYKKMYLDMEARLKKLSEEKKQNVIVLPKTTTQASESVVHKADESADAKRNLMNNLQGQPLNEGQDKPESSQDQGNAIDQLPNQPEGAPGVHQDSRHPLPAPHMVAPNPGELHQQEAEEGEGKGQDGQGGASQDGEQPVNVQGLREQVQPPEFKRQQEMPVESSSVKTSSPSSGGAGGQQLHLPPANPPPPQLEGNNILQQQPPQLQAHQPPAPFPPQSQQLAPQSQEQRDQDTLVRKPMLEPEVAGNGGQAMGGQHDGLFMAMPPGWHQMARDMAANQQQIRSPEARARPNHNNHMNNGLHPEEDDNYPEDGDDDNAEEQDETLREKIAKKFQDHDFEDNDGNEHNHAKEEGIIISPK